MEMTKVLKTGGLIKMGKISKTKSFIFRYIPFTVDRKLYKEQTFS
jgi:hypothetical protein